MTHALVAILFFLGGYAVGSIHDYVDNIDHCTSYSTKHATWVGFRAISESNERRCFWVEDRFPNRVQHGVEVKR